MTGIRLSLTHIVLLLDAYIIASEIVRNGKASLKEKAQAGDCSSSAQPPNIDKHEKASTNGMKLIYEATTSGCSKDIPLVDLTGGYRGGRQ